MSAVSRQIGYEQSTGTFEALAASPTGILGLADIAFFALAGAFVFGVDFGRANVPAVFVVALLSMLSFGSLGIISASFTSPRTIAGPW